MTSVPDPDAPPQPLWRKALPALAIFCAFALAGGFLFANCPPLWRDYDGLIQIADRPNDMTLLQYPPAYPFFSRMHIYAAEIISDWVHHTRVSIRIRKPVTLNDAGIYALIISQQLALALALTYFTLVCAREWKGRLVIVLLLLSNAAIFLPAQLISTEALTQSLLVLFVALGCRLFRTERVSAWGWGAYALCLFGLIMTRHVNAVFAALLPLAYILLGLGGCFRKGSREARPWKLAGLFTVVGLACIVASDLTTRLLCRAFSVPYRDISARGTAEKLGFVALMTPPEREAFLAQLEAKSSDPIVKEAIPLLARSASWDKQRQAIEILLLRATPSLPGPKLRVAADAYLDRVTRLFYATHNHYLLQGMFEATWRTFGQTTADDLSQYFLHTATWSIDLYSADASLHRQTGDLAVCRPEEKDRIVAFGRNPWLRVWDWAPHGFFLLVSGVAAVFLLARRAQNPAALTYAVALVGVSIVSTFLTFYFVNFQARFTSIAALLAFLSLGLVIGSFSPSREQAPAGLSKLPG